MRGWLRSSAWLSWDSPARAQSLNLVSTDPVRLNENSVNGAVVTVRVAGAGGPAWLVTDGKVPAGRIRLVNGPPGLNIQSNIVTDPGNAGEGFNRTVAITLAYSGAGFDEDQSFMFRKHSCFLLPFHPVHE